MAKMTKKEAEELLGTTNSQEEWDENCKKIKEAFGDEIDNKWFWEALSRKSKEAPWKIFREGLQQGRK